MPIDLSRLFDEADPNYRIWIETVLDRTLDILERAQEGA